MELTIHLILCKIQPTVYTRIANQTWGQDNSGGQVDSVALSQGKLAGKVTNNCSLSIHKHFGSPNWNNSWHGECHVMPRFKI